MTEDLETMDREELKQVIAEARKRIAAAERAIATLDARRRAEARRAAEAAVREFGFELSEVFDVPERGSRARGRAKATADGERSGGKTSARVVRYRNPADPRQTWSGIGRRPKWIAEAERAGRDRSEFAA